MKCYTLQNNQIDHGGRDMGFARDTSSWYGKHVCQVISKPFYTYNPDTNVYTFYLYL
jgi:hypothetical protein